LGIQAQSIIKHNIGKDWLVDLSQEINLTFEPKKKFESSIASSHEGRVLWVVPDNYVNNSGSTVKKIIKNNNLDMKNIIVLHDDLDLNPGDVRLKIDGGHGGHNGLRDIFQKTGSKEFIRIRIGIGHPGMKSEVNKWVLSKFNPADKECLKKSYNKLLGAFNKICNKDFAEAQKYLHTN
jgi:PTH1 family peptidyl-tRNA hydrolase